MNHPQYIHPLCRLYIILARSRPIGVIFRRGPTDWVQLILWHTDTDTFEEGQWLHGRVFERYCDLSPEGDKLLYFASKHYYRKVPDTQNFWGWTAISRPPYLTALVFWPYLDRYYGGGLYFEDRVLLYHFPDVEGIDPNVNPGDLKIEEMPQENRRGFPAESARMARDGWIRLQKGYYPRKDRKRVTEERAIWTKFSPDEDQQLIYELSEIRKRSYGTGPFIETYKLSIPDNDQDIQLDTTFADWDHQGRLIFVNEGKLFAATIEGLKIQSQELADFSNSRPTSIEAPVWATKW